MNIKEDSPQRTQVVSIVQRYLTHYRVDLFEQMKADLRKHNITLRLIVGRPRSSEKQRNDHAHIGWAQTVDTRYLLNEKLCWQPIEPLLEGSSLVVLTQENSLLANWLVLTKHRPYKVALWGHGANLQSASPNGYKERIKKWLSAKADWWFTYTEATSETVREFGFPAERITSVNNSINTRKLKVLIDQTTSQDLHKFKLSLGLNHGPIGLFMGSLNDIKRIPFLLSSTQTIRNEIADFQLIIVGDGPQSPLVEAFCKQHDWAIWLGAQLGQTKAMCLAISDLMLNPGAVGLNILDAFSGSCPLVTTNCHTHGPELAYLQNNINGIITTDSDYSQTVVQTLTRKPALATLKNGCEVSSKIYTVENMSSRFVKGIVEATQAGSAKSTLPA